MSKQCYSLLIELSMFIHCSTIAHSLSMHRVFTADTVCIMHCLLQSIHCLFTVPSLLLCHKHHLWTISSMSLCCLFTVCSLSVHCLFAASSLSLHCLFTVYLLSTHCLFTVHTLIHFISPAYYCPCTVQSVRICYRLPIYWLFTVCVCVCVHVSRYLFTRYSLCVQCLFSNLLSIRCLLRCLCTVLPPLGHHVYSLSIRCLFTVYSLSSHWV
jgi:hypothetical protein